ncbi:MAG: SAM-dependent chlorinase/fluorinase [Desulfobacterales bacterium]|nr:SAM-dependent chlorinase/fluorinase [Desulfobacterales bacterium]
MCIITLLTDFGLADAYVGVMKGVILTINPKARIVDISHQVKPQNILQASYILKTAYSYFPEQSIHVVVVDPGVGTDRSIIALKTNRHVFLAPDNGVLSMVMHEAHPELAVNVTEKQYFLKTMSHTFHGRDIFAPVAAYLSTGIPIDVLGESIPCDNIKKLPQISCHIAETGNIHGTIIHVDHFGNLITNIDYQALNYFGENKQQLQTHINGQCIKGISACYEQVPMHHPLVLIGSSGYLEISVHQGSAKQYFHAGIHDPVFIDRMVS